MVLVKSHSLKEECFTILTLLRIQPQSFTMIKIAQMTWQMLRNLQAVQDTDIRPSTARLPNGSNVNSSTCYELTPAATLYTTSKKYF